MDTKLRKYSHSFITKIIVFFLVILCFTGIIKAIVEVEVVNNGDFNSVVEENYFKSKAFMRESSQLVGDLTRLLGEFKNEDHILAGNTIDKYEWQEKEDELYLDFQYYSNKYDHEVSDSKNYETFKTDYKEEIIQAKGDLIKEDLKEYKLLLQKIQEYRAPLFYASDGTNVFKNTTEIEPSNFKKLPAYLLFENYKREMFPKEIEENDYLYWITEPIDELNQEQTIVYTNELEENNELDLSIDPSDELNQEHMVMYIAYPEAFLQKEMKEWKESKEVATKSLYWMIGLSIGFLLSFIYLIVVTGRRGFREKELHFNWFDKLFIDLNIIFCISLVMLYVLLVDAFYTYIDQLVVFYTIPIASVFFLLLLSIVKHFKNRTLYKHTLIYRLINNLVQFFMNVYRSGNIAVKTVFRVIGYPLLVAATFFMFPVTIGIAAWFAFKKVKSFQAIQTGVKVIKDGNLQHRIEVEGKGEFAGLAANINSITDGLKKAVDSELKSERLKTELITNVSHDIRTPLTSIITYVDLLKFEKDTAKIEEYVEVLDQKAKRLKVLTDDLFDAAKASSGNIPVNFEKIDIVSLITQGLGEVNDKIEDMELDIKFNYPVEKLYVAADGKLLWRSIENLLSNIFKYALPKSRVYIDIENLESETKITFKNISASELNISADELMERFKRGDEARTSEGSGLGLSIAKNLIEIQKGKFFIEIDGDLFKAMIYLPNHDFNHASKADALMEEH